MFMSQAGAAGCSTEPQRVSSCCYYYTAYQIQVDPEFQDPHSAHYGSDEHCLFSLPQALISESRERSFFLAPGTNFRQQRTLFLPCPGCWFLETGGALFPLALGSFSLLWQCFAWAVCHSFQYISVLTDITSWKKIELIWWYILFYRDSFCMLLYQ